MRLLKAVMRLLGLGESQSIQPSVPVEQPLSIAKPSRAKSGRPCKAAQEQSKPAKPKAKRKPKAAPSTKAVASRKPAKKSAQAVSGATGKQRATRASKTRQHAK